MSYSASFGAKISRMMPTNASTGTSPRRCQPEGQNIMSGSTPKMNTPPNATEGGALIASDRHLG